MRKSRRVLVFLMAVVAGTIVAIPVLFNIRYPNVGPSPQLNIERTAARLERGGYLVNHVTVCLDCHSTRDYTIVGGPIVKGTEGMGGFAFDESIGFPGTVTAKNITPAVIGQWTDGELYRAITAGVTRDGSALFPLMPYRAYTNLSEEDLLSIITYIRTLKPIQNQVPSTRLNFPLNIIVKTIPSEHTAAPEPNKNNAFDYGKYLVNAANCIDCHTMQVKGEFVKGMEYAGGFAVPFPSGIVRSANITPDEETGIGLWSKDVFIARFRQFADTNYIKQKADSLKYYTYMPWPMFAGMTDSDLDAVYGYLRTLPPVKHRVDHFTLAVAQKPLTSD